MPTTLVCFYHVQAIFSKMVGTLGPSLCISLVSIGDLYSALCMSLDPWALVIPQAVFTLRGSNGVGFRLWLLILRQPVPGTRALSNTVCMQSKSMSRSSRAGETLTCFKYADLYNRKTTFSCQITAWPALGTKRPGIPESCNPGFWGSWNLGILESGIECPFLKTGFPFLKTGCLS